MAVVRDEMRTPLMGLEALLDSMAGTAVSPELTTRMRDQSRVLATRVMLLIEDLALVASQGEESLALDLQDLDLDDHLAACRDSFPDLLIRIEGDTGVRVHADALRVHQMLANLMRNAMRHGHGPVTVKVARQAGFVAVRLSDAGPRDGYELDLARALVRAHGGMAIHEVGGAYIFTLPRSASANLRPVPALAR